jgi:hypothetical protein
MVVTAPVAATKDSSLQRLSKELLIAKTVLELQEQAKALSFDELVEALRPVAPRQIVSRAVDALFDKGVLKAEWTKRPDGVSVRVFEVAGEAKEYVKIVSRDYQSLLTA